MLPNGLRVLSTPMPHTRSVTVSFYVGAGARYEADELAGVSHLVEHCVFKGSAARPHAADISMAIEGVGGVINAATGPRVHRLLRQSARPAAWIRPWM